MTITRIDQGPRLSEAVIHGDTIYLAGQVGTPGESVAAQTREALAEIEALLARTGSGKTICFRPPSGWRIWRISRR